MNWPWSKPTPPPAAPAGSPERARRIARAASLWNERRRDVGLHADRIAHLEKKAAEERVLLAQAEADEVTARAELEEATRG